MASKSESEVLVRSGRRCCLCYGLGGHFDVKPGQIAHLDGKPDHNHLNNLAFLCFEHHDQYDGSTSQSKGITREEVLFYRDVLYRDVERGLPRPGPLSAGDVHELVASIRASERWPGALLNHVEIRKAVETGILQIDPFDGMQLGAASYGLRVGESALVGAAPRPIIEGRPAILKPAEHALVVSMEYLSLPAVILGRLMPVSAFHIRGAAVAAGAHIEPGYQGHLIIAVENRSRRRLMLSRGETLASLEFLPLAPVGEKPNAYRRIRPIAL